MAQYPFPNIAQSEEAKSKKSYYEAWVRAVVCNTFNSAWITQYNHLSTLNNFYKHGTGSDLTGYLQTAPDGSAMPGIWMSINSVFTRMESLIGELEERGYMIKVRALNSEAVSRKLEEKERLRIKRELQEVVQYAEELTGIPLEKKEYVPQTDNELNEYMDLTWKDKHVMIVESALKWLAHRNDWTEVRKQLFMDILIGNMMVVRNEIVDGVPDSPRVDPMRFIHDPSCTDDRLKDSTYFGEVDYVPLATAAERYGLTMEEMLEAQKEYKDYLGMKTDSSPLGFGCMPNQSLKWFKVEDGTTKCLVIKAAWLDYLLLAHKDETNEKGSFFQDITYNPEEINKKRNKDNIVYNKLGCWRQGTLVGGKFLREWGECPNQPRELNSLQKAEPPYTVWKLNRSLSMVERLMGPQVQKDISLYQLQIQTARAIGKVLIFDEAAMPQGMTKESVMRYIKADGMAWVNSKEYQLNPGSSNLFQAVDVGLSESITQNINLIHYYDQQLDQISGVGPERQGQVQGASQAVGVTNSALFQSNLITAPYFKGFERFCSRVLTYQAKLVKLAWAGKEVFAPIIGDLGVDFLKDNIDISLDEFDAECLSLPPSNENRQKLENLIMMAVQADPESIDDYLDILFEHDQAVAIIKFKRIRALRRMKMEKQAQQQSEQDNAMREEELGLQREQLAFQQQNSPLQLQQMKNQGSVQKTLIGSRTKLNSEKLRIQSGR